VEAYSQERSASAATTAPEIGGCCTAAAEREAAASAANSDIVRQTTAMSARTRAICKSVRVLWSMLGDTGSTLNCGESCV